MEPIKFSGLNDNLNAYEYYLKIVDDNVATNKYEHISIVCTNTDDAGVWIEFDYVSHIQKDEKVILEQVNTEYVRERKINKIINAN